MKTYYSVNYRKIGADNISTKWFDSLKEAKEFASRDYSDNVVVHNINNKKRIAEIEALMMIVQEWN